MFERAALLVFAAVVAPLDAQIVAAHLPDSDPTTGVAANSIPFNPTFGPTPGAYTQMLVVPAAQLALLGVTPGAQLLDISLAPCGSGVLTMQAFKASVGHLASPYPSPLLSAAFADQSALYDSDVSGPFTWNVVGDTWTSLGLGGGGFVWDGINDVGVHTTHQGLAISAINGWPGTFWRGAAALRLYAPGYEAQSAAVISPSALKIKLVFATGPDAYASVAPYGTASAGQNGAPTIAAVGLPQFDNPAFFVNLANAYPGASALLAWSAAPANAYAGTGGADVRLNVDFGPTTIFGFHARLVDAQGTASVGFSIPSFDPASVGVHVYAQWFLVGDPGAQPTVYGVNLAATAALDVRVGL